jgi:glycosyltransferase involved in cell wall biosynthesis
VVSVCIPTYKGDGFLGAAIDSVLAQTFTDFELIIVDDHSPDTTAALVSRYEDSRIRYLRNESNVGPQENWNRCLAEASGKYFKLLPQDDLLASDCIARQVAVLDEDVEHRIALVFCARSIIGPNGKTILQRGYPGGREGALAGARLIAGCVRRGTNLIGEPAAVMIRKELATTTGSFDACNPYVIDLDYWFRLLNRGDAYYIPQTLASFRVLPTSWSVAIGAMQTSDFRKFISKTARERQDIRWLDRVCGNVMAAVNTFLRHIFYRFILK